MRFVFLSVLATLVSWNALFAEGVSFREQIAPILQRRCANCHNEENSKGHYRLDSFAYLQKTGESDLPPVVAGKSGESEIYRLLLEPNAEDRMPQKADPLPDDEIAAIKAWLDQGAIYDGGSVDKSIAELARESLLRKAPEQYARAIPVAALAFGPGGNLLATAGYYEVLIWNLETGNLSRRIGGMPEKITCITWNAKTNLIAIGGGSPGQWGTVAIIRPSEDYSVKILSDFADTALTVAISPDGATLAVGGSDRALRVFDINSGKQTKLLRVHADWVQQVSFSRDGSHLLSVGRDRTAKVLSTKDWEVASTYTEHETAVIAGTFLNQDGSRVLTADRSKSLHEWDGRSGDKRDIHHLLATEPVQLVYRDGQVIAAGNGLGITVDQLSDDQHIMSMVGHRDAILSLAFAPDGSKLASGSADGEVLIWNPYCGTWTHRFIASPVARPQEPQLTSTR